MATELLELYQQLGQLVWDLFQQRMIETLSTSLTDQTLLIEKGWTKDGILEVTQSRMNETKTSIAQTFLQLQAHPAAPEEPLLRLLRNKLE
jgi:hypothetical protein